MTSPLITGIFLRIVFEAAYQELNEGSALISITPFRRVVDINSNIAKKLGCALDFIINQQKLEKIKTLSV